MERPNNANMEPRKEQSISPITHSIHLDAYYQGFHVEVTQTDPNAMEETYQLIRNAQDIIDFMIKKGNWMSSWKNETPKQFDNAKPGESKIVYKSEEQKEEVPICRIHNIPMTWKTGVSQKTNKPYAFWSCSGKNPDGSWCFYKPPKE